jgi:hypothetical protein
VEKESADEFLGREGHGFLLTFVSVVLPSEVDLTTFDVLEAIIGDGHTVGVAADVIQYLLRAGERRLGIDHPFGFSYRFQIAGKRVTIAKFFQDGKELELAGVESPLEMLQKQATEQARQHPHRQEESRPAGDPAGAVGRQSAAGDHAMSMWMMK